MAFSDANALRIEKFAFVVFVTCENENYGALVYLQLLTCFYICPICLSFAIPTEHQWPFQFVFAYVIA